MKKYELTDEHKAMLPEWREKWIKNAMRCTPMTEEEKVRAREAAKGLYIAAGLTPPPDHRIVFVPSPFVLRFAGGFAAAIWHQRKTGKVAATRAAINDAARAATYDAAYDATRAATRDATYDATRAVTYDATSDATYAATRDATYDAAYDATYAATHDATYGAARDATRAAAYDAIDNATYDATDAATYDATDAATDNAPYDATRAAIDNATDAATRAATYDAAYAATRDATHGATYGAARDATRAVTYAVTRDATDAATRAATYDATYDAARAATYDAENQIEKHDRWYNINPTQMAKLASAIGVGLLGLKCAANAYNMWQGGNQWSAGDSFLTFFRHISKLPLDYSKYDHWETLAKCSGPRIMHPDFCMISDFPTFLQVDQQNRPHCETGPFSAWADGSGLYALHGVRVPVWAIETPKDEIDPKDILALENTEQRYALMRYVGLEKFLDALKAELISEENEYKLYTIDLEGTRSGPFLRMACPSTGREFFEGVGDPDKFDALDTTIKTCKQAIEWRWMRASGGKMTGVSENIFRA